MVDISRLFVNGPAPVLQSIAIGYGKVNFSNSSVTLAGFVAEAPFLRTLCSKKLVRNRSTNRIPCSSQPDINGWLYSDSLQGPDGTIVLIQMSQKWGGSGIRDGAIAIRLREAGAFLIISANLPDDTSSLLPSANHLVFSGAGDILTPDELLEAGIEANKNYINGFMNPEEVAECFTTAVVRPARSSPPLIETHVNQSGETVVVVTEKRTRRMRIRKQ